MVRHVKARPSKPEQPQDLRQSSKAPLVFISHDSRDAELAEAFSKLLGSVSAGVLKTFRSSDRKGSQGIEYGVEWYPEIKSKLEAASDVVCLLTPRSYERPWILYESGMAQASNIPVNGIALGIAFNRVNTTGPFALFHNCDDDEDSLTKLVTQLLSRIPGSEPDRDVILTQVKVFKQTTAQILAKFGDSTEESEGAPGTSVTKLFEEVKVMFQDLPARIEERVGDGPFRRRRGRMHPMMLDEMMHIMGDRPDEPTVLLLVASLLRDDAPWLYELGREAYEKCETGSQKEADRALERFRRAVHFSTRGPMMEEMGMHPRALRDVEHILESFVEGPRRLRGKKKPDEEPSAPNQP
jgi:hypothetical protein